MYRGYPGKIIRIDLSNHKIDIQQLDEDFEKALKLRYELMGWNPDNGVPTPAKLIELNLD
jgi:aldehyde:ferredoxin oxidoreductase